MFHFDSIREVKMRFFARFCVQLVLSAALFGQVRLTLADAVAQALAGNPRLGVASARVGVAEGLRKQADFLDHVADVAAELDRIPIERGFPFD